MQKVRSKILVSWDLDIVQEKPVLPQPFVWIKKRDKNNFLKLRFTNWDILKDYRIANKRIVL